jgi:hypothetical protein
MGVVLGSMLEAAGCHILMFPGGNRQIKILLFSQKSKRMTLPDH